MTDEQLQALLRLKRYEQPPAGYYEQLLRDIHQRQRAELLRRPLWRIGWERVEAFFSEVHAAAFPVAGATAAAAVVLFAGLATLSPERGTGPAIAATAPGTVVRTASAPAAVAHPMVEGELDVWRPAVAYADAGTPRYVIDARPVSYELSSSF